jgi:3-oxoacyl-(acyl-carrier-protein) synthase
VVTGLGVVTAYGLGRKIFWDGIKSGESAIRAIDWEGWEEAPIQVLARVREAVPENESRSLFWGREALREALEMSQPGRDGGLAGAIGWPGPGEEGEDPLAKLAGEMGIVGPRVESLAACAASTQVIGEAFRMIREGETDWMAAGGADGRAHPGGLMGYDRLGALARGFRDRPQEACQPFGRERSGFVVGEGAGFLVLEEKERAKKRGAKILAEIHGAAEGCDAWRVTDPREDTQEAVACVEACLRDAGIRPEDVDSVVAHGTGTPANDRAEARMLAQVFGRKQPRLSAPKARMGHLSMACGAVESVLAVQSLTEDFFPSTVGSYWQADPDCPVRMVQGRGEKGVRVVLKPSFGFGGQNACLLFRQA